MYRPDGSSDVAVNLPRSPPASLVPSMTIVPRAVQAKRGGASVAFALAASKTAKRTIEARNTNFPAETRTRYALMEAFCLSRAAPLFTPGVAADTQPESFPSHGERGS